MIKKMVLIIILLFLPVFMLPNNVRAEDTVSDLLRQMKAESEEVISFLEERTEELKDALNKEKKEYAKRENSISYLQVMEDTTVNAKIGDYLEHHIRDTKANFKKMKYVNMKHIKKIQHDIFRVEIAIENVATYRIFTSIVEHLTKMDYFDDKESLKRSLKMDLDLLKKLNNEIEKEKKNWQLTSQFF